MLTDGRSFSRWRLVDGAASFVLALVGVGLFWLLLPLLPLLLLFAVPALVVVMVMLPSAGWRPVCCGFPDITPPVYAA